MIFCIRFWGLFWDGASADYSGKDSWADSGEDSSVKASEESSGIDSGEDLLWKILL